MSRQDLALGGWISQRALLSQERELCHVVACAQRIVVGPDGCVSETCFAWTDAIPAESSVSLAIRCILARKVASPSPILGIAPYDG